MAEACRYDGISDVYLWEGNGSRAGRDEFAARPQAPDVELKREPRALPRASRPRSGPDQSLNSLAAQESGPLV